MIERRRKTIENALLLIFIFLAMAGVIFFVDIKQKDNIDLAGLIDNAITQCSLTGSKLYKPNSDIRIGEKFRIRFNAQCGAVIYRTDDISIFSFDDIHAGAGDDTQQGKY